MSIDTKKIESLLGSQIKFIPSRTDNVHTVKTDKNLSPSAAALYLENNNVWTNAKIDATSSPEGYCWIILDYDDKKETGKIVNLQQTFNLEPTFSIKTPTGAGKQDWYLIKEKYANQLPRLKYEIPSIKNVEIFVAHKTDNWCFVAPGSRKDNGEYQFINDIKPAKISKMLFDTLLVQARAHEDAILTQLDINKESFQSNVDEVQNKRYYLNYLNKVCEPYILGEKEPEGEGGRDSFVYAHIVQGFTYNLSKETVREMAVDKLLDQRVLYDLAGEFNEERITEKINSAFNNVMDAKRNTERSTDQAVEPFISDTYGNRTVTRDALTEKVLRLKKYRMSLVVMDEVLRRMLCETIVLCPIRDKYYVANIMSHKQYDKLYDKQIKNEASSLGIIDFDRILAMKSTTKLHWLEMREDQLKRIYRYTSSGGRPKPIVSWAEWSQHHFQANMFTSTEEEDIIIEEDAFFKVEHGPFDLIPESEIKPKEIKRVTKLIEGHIARIVDKNNFEEESSWLLDRYASLLQNQDDRIENLLILKGSQGSGKTSFINMMMIMFPKSKTNIYYDIEEIKGKFFDSRHVTHFDDVNLNKSDFVVNILKAFTTTSQISREVKFETRILEHGSFNPSITTNDDINDPEFIIGRRNTILENNTIVSVDRIKEEVVKTFKALKADNFRLYNVLYSMLMVRDVSNFKSNYKSSKQKEMMMNLHKKSDFTIGLANMIANYGYISDYCQPIEPKELTNKNDFNAAIFNHYLLLDDNDLEPAEAINLKEIPGFRLANHLVEEKSRNASIRAEFNELFKTPDSTGCASKINKHIHHTNAIEIPPIKDWIKFLTIIFMNNADKENISHIVKQFKFEAQMEWDNKTKPEIAKLGFINVFDYVEFEEEEEEY